MRIIFEHAHSRFSGVETGAAALQNFVTSCQSALESRAIFALFFRRYLAALNSPGAAVDHESNFFRFHVWLIFLGKRPRRSEERRVGKECRLRLARCHGKEN